MIEKRAEESMQDEIKSPSGRVYQCSKKLGEGGFGITHLAADGDGNQVVIKQLKIERLDDWKAVELFEREGKVLETLRHPCIPAYIDAFPLGEVEAPSGFALVQEYVPGRSLVEWMQEEESLSLEKHLRWFFEVLDVLTYLHALDPPVIHRDLTPKNVMIRQGDGQTFLIDFGTVQAAMISATAISSTMAGTFGYAPMEQFVGRATPASDLYALGVTFVSAVTQKTPEQLPFEDNRLDINQALKGYGVDARLRLILEQMTEPEPGRRVQSAQEVLGRVGLLRPDIVGEGDVSEENVEEVVQEEASNAQEEEAQQEEEEVPVPDMSSFSAPWRVALERWKQVEKGQMWDVPPVAKHYGVMDFDVSDDGSLLAVVYEGALEVVDLAEYQRVLRYEGYFSDPFVRFVRGAHHVLVCDYFSEVFVLFTRGDAGEYLEPRRFDTFGKDVSAVDMAVGPDADLVAVVPDMDEGAMLVSCEDGAFVRDITPEQGDDSFTSVEFSSDGKILAVGRYAHMTLYDAQGESTTMKWKHFTMSADGMMFACVKYDDSDRVFLAQNVDISSLEDVEGASLEKLEVALESPTRLTFSPDGSLLAFASESKSDVEVIVWNVKEKKVQCRVKSLATGEALAGYVERLCFATNDRLWIRGETTISPFSEHTHDQLLVADTHGGEVLGGFLVLESDNKTTFVDEYTLSMQSKQGFFMSLVVDGLVRENGHRMEPWESRDKALGFLRQEQSEELLTEQELIFVEDLLQRFEAFVDAKKQGVVQHNASVPKLAKQFRGNDPLDSLCLARGRGSCKPQGRFWRQGQGVGIQKVYSASPCGFTTTG